MKVHTAKQVIWLAQELSKPLDRLLAATPVYEYGCVTEGIAPRLKEWLYEDKRVSSLMCFAMITHLESHLRGMENEPVRDWKDIFEVLGWAGLTYLCMLSLTARTTPSDEDCCAVINKVNIVPSIVNVILLLEDAERTRWEHLPGISLTRARRGFRELENSQRVKDRINDLLYRCPKDS